MSLSLGSEHARHGTSVHGAASKKPQGLSAKETCSAGMMGQSSVRTQWVTPKTLGGGTVILV